MDEYHALAVAAVNALQLANQPKWTEVVGAFIGLAQCGLITWGIWTMKRSSEFRDLAHERRHQESMTALKTLIERTAPSHR